MKKNKLKIIEVPKTFFNQEMSFDSLMKNELSLILGGECGNNYCSGGYCPKDYCPNVYCSSNYTHD
jgi:hypothetical protein